MNPPPLPPPPIDAAIRRALAALTDENAALRARDHAAAATLLPAKTDAAEALRTALTADTAARPDPALLQHLADASAANAALLAEAIAVQGKILGMVARAARTGAPPPQHYARPGARRAALGAQALAFQA